MLMIKLGIDFQEISESNPLSRLPRATIEKKCTHDMPPLGGVHSHQKDENLACIKIIFLQHILKDP
jgi:hypothetical protein